MATTIRKNLVSKFKPLLKEGLVYSVKNFKDVINSGDYRVVNSKFKIIFTLLTTIKRVEENEPSIPLHGFEYGKEKTVNTRVNDDTILTEIGDLETVGGGYTKGTWKLLRITRSLAKLHCGENLFDIHYRYSSVEQLPFHLPNEHTVSDALRLWNTHYEALSEDIAIMQAKRFKVNNLKLTAAKIEAYTLFEIESIMLKTGKSLKEVDGMPLPNQSLLHESRNRLVNEELDYNREDLRVVHDTNFLLLNQCQKKSYDAIMDYVYEDRDDLLFIHGRGGTWKTFLWKTIIARLRSEGKIVLPVASSGIAALLLPNWRTAYSRFRIPLDVTAESTSLDKSLRDILSILSTRYEDSISRLFTGLTVVCGGDFRQILLVIPKGSRLDIVNASLSSSYLWPLFRVYELNQNMRLLQKDMPPSEVCDIKAFDGWMLQIGDGSYYDNFEDEMLRHLFKTIGGLDPMDS
ncbi:hypothetical protein OSB04_020011 [Centaurea solstitialis]|uniref:ATP-dependent DNA helicase n=1 Tax=Centaurea solstitialis TaxID=347529 RepID=A0AA38SRX1_9ASTR|nr:hypothetical protein OSB04_020011 [Centaurea solstitialis]